MHKEIEKLLRGMEQERASDLHVTANSPLHYRIDNELIKIDEHDLTPEEAKTMTYSLMNEEQIKKFEEEGSGGSG